jgi:Tfp pilus assembly protein PilF
LTASVASFLAQAQKKGAEFPAALSGALLLAAIRLSESKMQAVRPYQLLVDDDGALDLLIGDPPTDDGYAAPELRNGAVLPEDPRVLVYAVGALGYELITLTPPRPGQGKGGELTGPLAPVIRKAMSDRQQRYKTLGDMARAIERIQRRPSREEERLILADVAASTPLPPAQKLAKMELGRAASPEDAPPAPGTATEPQPVFTPVWDPLEAQQQPAPTAPAPVEHRPESAPEPDSLRAELEGERKAWRDLTAAMESRNQDLAQLGTRLALLEEQVRSSLPPPVSAAASLASDVMQLLEQRRFAEAERVLLDARVHNDAVLQFALGQTLSSLPDSDGSRASRAETAFRRAAVLDATWAQPRARLGALLWRQGKQVEARKQFDAALKLDPTCPEALAVLSAPRPRTPAFAVSTAVSALAAAAMVLAFRPSQRASAPGGGPAISAASVAPAPQAAPRPSAAPTSPPPAPAAVALRLPEPSPAPATPAPAPKPTPAPASGPKTQSRTADRKPEPNVEREPEPAPRPEPRKKKVVAASGNRAAAEAESARGDKSLRTFDTKGAEAAFTAALQLDPTFPSAHRGMGMVYVLLGRNSEAKAEYSRYLQLAPDAPDREQIARLLAR